MGSDELHGNCTVRPHDPATGEVDQDIAIHTGGIGAHRATTTTAGDVVGIGAPETLPG